MAREVVSFSIVLTMYACDVEGVEGPVVAWCDTTRNRDKSRHSRSAHFPETHSIEHLPKCMVLHNWNVQQISVSCDHWFHCMVDEKYFS
jgi:hypothetical protein